MSKKTATTATTEYRCLGAVNHDGEDYAVGDPITLEDKHAKPLLAVNAIELPTADELEAPSGTAAATSTAAPTSTAAKAAAKTAAGSK